MTTEFGCCENMLGQSLGFLSCVKKVNTKEFFMVKVFIGWFSVEVLTNVVMKQDLYDILYVVNFFSLR